MDRLPVDQLAALLRAHARGYYPEEAAVELLVGHGSWLRRGEFLGSCVVHDLDAPDGPQAWIDWAEVAGLVVVDPGCSSSEARILRLAAELAGETTHTPLAELLTGLDDHNQVLVLDAISHAMGTRPAHLEQAGDGS